LGRGEKLSELQDKTSDLHSQVHVIPYKKIQNSSLVLLFLPGMHNQPALYVCNSGTGVQETRGENS
jgi:hypothetical protein